MTLSCLPTINRTNLDQLSDRYCLQSLLCNGGPILFVTQTLQSAVMVWRLTETTHYSPVLGSVHRAQAYNINCCMMIVVAWPT